MRHAALITDPAKHILKGKGLGKTLNACPGGEMVDTQVLGTCALQRGGSSPLPGTKITRTKTLN